MLTLILFIAAGNFARCENAQTITEQTTILMPAWDGGPGVTIVAQTIDANTIVPFQIRPVIELQLLPAPEEVSGPMQSFYLNSTGTNMEIMDLSYIPKNYTTTYGTVENTKQYTQEGWCLLVWPILNGEC